MRRTTCTRCGGYGPYSLYSWPPPKPVETDAFEEAKPYNSTWLCVRCIYHLEMGTAANDPVPARA
jgi:hypothetical protein